MQTKDSRQPNDPLSSLGILPYQPIISPVVGEVLSDGAGALMGLKLVMSSPLFMVNQSMIG